MFIIVNWEERRFEGSFETFQDAIGWMDAEVTGWDNMPEDGDYSLYNTEEDDLSTMLFEKTILISVEE